MRPRGIRPSAWKRYAITSRLSPGWSSVMNRLSPLDREWGALLLTWGTLGDVLEI